MLSWLRRLAARLPAVRNSLRFRLTLGATLALAVLITAFIVFHYRELQEQMVQSAKTNLVSAGQVIEDSLQHAMLTQNAEELQRIVDNVARQPNIRTLMVLNKSSEIRFAPGGQDIGTRLDLQQPGCVDCHRGSTQPDDRTIVFETAPGDPVLRYCIPIRNLPQCYACHDATTSLNGALIADFSLAETQNRIDAELRADVLAGLLLIGASALTVNVLLDRLILSRLERMMPAIRRLGQGDPAQRMAPQGQDEIGQLATAFNQMADGLQSQEQETARLYQELQHKEAARTKLLQRLIGVQEEERKRIARELHDDFAQTLTALTLGLETALQTLPPEQAPVKAQLTQVQDLTVTTLGQTHDWIQDLRPRILDDLGLVAALRWYAEARLSSAGVAVELDLGQLRWRLPVELETTLFRVVQEAINNVAKHAQARHARIRLEVVDSSVRAHVEDDGVGFTPQDYPASPDGMRGIGLVGMHERVALVSGTLVVTSAPGHGTHVQIEVPWSP